MAQKTFNGTKINVEFAESSSRQQLNSGENISTLFGKIKKIFSDLKAVCFSGSYNDLNDKPSALPANGGNSLTVNGHTVNSDVPYNAVFTDTVYNDAHIISALEGKSGIGHTHSRLEITDFPSALPANGGNADTVGNISDGYYIGLFSNVGTKLPADTRLYGKYNGKTNDGRMFLTTTPNSDNIIHEVAVAYAYDAELLNHRESGRIATRNIDGTYYNPINKHEYDAYIQWNGSHFVLKTYSGNATAVDYAYTANAANSANYANSANSANSANYANSANIANSATYANIVKTPYLIGTSANCAYNTILAWANDQTGTAYASIVAGDGFPSDAPYQNEAMLKVESDYYGARKIVTWTRYMGGQPRLVMIRPIFGTNWNDDQWRT